MFSGEFLMDLGMATLGAGIVGAIAVLFGVLISNKTIRIKMEGEHESLKEGNIALSKEHENLSQGNAKLELEIKETQKNINLNQEKLSEKITSVKEIIIEEKTKEEFRYANLTEKQKDIVETVKNIRCMADELQAQQENIISLKKELEMRKEENKNLKYLEEEVNKLIKENTKLKDKIKDLEDENIELRKNREGKPRERGM